MPRKTGLSRLQYGLFATPLEDKIAHKLERIENRIDEYLNELDAFDAREMEEETPDVKALLLALADLDERKEQLIEMDDLLLAAKTEDPHGTQISLTDLEARMLPLNNEGMMELVCNVQSSEGFNYTLLKSKEKVSGEMAIIFTAYNLRRSMSILGVSALKEALKSHFSRFFALGRATDRPVVAIRPAAPWRVSAGLAQVWKRA